MKDLKSFAEELVNMTTKGAAQLAQVLKEEYGIEAAAAEVVATKTKRIGNTDYVHEQENFRRNRGYRDQKVTSMRKGKPQNFRRR